jgi:hypothetical protein
VEGLLLHTTLTFETRREQLTNQFTPTSEAQTSLVPAIVSPCFSRLTDSYATHPLAALTPLLRSPPNELQATTQSNIAMAQNLGATFVPGGWDDYYMPEVVAPSPQR